MTKQELVEFIADKAGLTKADATRALDATLEAITEALVDGKDVKLAGFGKFAVVERQEREGRNPSTGESMTIPACNVCKFKPSSVLKEAVK